MSELEDRVEKTLRRFPAYDYPDTHKLIKDQAARIEELEASKEILLAALRRIFDNNYEDLEKGMPAWKIAEQALAGDMKLTFNQDVVL